MSSVYCSPDPAWSLKLLQAAAASVEELDLQFAREDHLLATHAMPRLQRLHLYWDHRCKDQPAELPALAAPSSLQWLRVDGLSRATLQSLLRAHGASLRRLTLSVGVTYAPSSGQYWPYGCNDLDALLAGCGLARLERLVLLRHSSHSKSNAARCRTQREAVRRALPAATVQCTECDQVTWEKF